MKKIHFFILLHILLTLNLKAQIKGLLNYTITIDNGITPNKQILKSIVYFNKNASIELPVTAEDIDNSNKTIYNTSNSGYSTVKANLSKTKFVFKDFYEKRLILADNIGINYILISDTLSNFKWKITNEHQKILKYKCTKATTTFRGRDYIAWFTDDIPLQNGPWKFCGLPGLILKVNDMENKFAYEITNINLKANFDDKIIAIPEIYTGKKTIDHKTFMERYQKKVLDLEIESKASVTITTNSKSMLTRRLPQKMEKF
jgi:GLPGLI family protein